MNPFSQKEKRAILENDRKVRESSSFHAHAIAELGDVGGRFASEIRQSVTGSTPGSQYPRQPSGSPWARDECPPEPPLGYSVDEQEAVGERHEIEASRGSPSASALA